MIRYLKKEWKTSMMVLAGNFLLALSVQVFLSPGNVVTGGVTGIAMALNSITEIPMSHFVFLMNILMLILGWIFLGRKFAVNTILSSVSYPVFLKIAEQIFGDRGITDDLLLCAVFGGIGMGLSLGIVIREGASTGGMDIPPLLAFKYLKVPVSVGMYAVDFIIIASQCLIFPVRNILYGIAMTMISSLVIDRVILRGTSRTEIRVISSRYEEISRKIMEDADCGVTMLNGRGGYLGQPQEMLLSIISNRQLPRIQKMILAVDPEAFVIVNRVSEVNGRGFTLEKEYL